MKTNLWLSAFSLADYSSAVTLESSEQKGKSSEMRFTKYMSLISSFYRKIAG